MSSTFNSVTARHAPPKIARQRHSWKNWPSDDEDDDDPLLTRLQERIITSGTTNDFWTERMQNWTDNLRSADEKVRLLASKFEPTFSEVLKEQRTTISWKSSSDKLTLLHYRSKLPLYRSFHAPQSERILRRTECKPCSYYGSSL